MHGCVCKPEETRPLSGMNTDSKILAICVRIKINSKVAEWAHPSQRGFIMGRSLLHNVVDIEAQSLLNAAYRTHAPATLLFDFKAAFPSLSRRYLFSTLKAV